MREHLLNGFREAAKYWAELPGNKSVRERCDGLAFTVLTMLDGVSGDLPAMNISLVPHEGDKAYHQSQGERWYEAGMVINDCELHDEYYK